MSGRGSAWPGAGGTDSAPGRQPRWCPAGDQDGPRCKTRTEADGLRAFELPAGAPMLDFRRLCAFGLLTKQLGGPGWGPVRHEGQQSTPLGRGPMQGEVRRLLRPRHEGTVTRAGRDPAIHQVEVRLTDLDKSSGFEPGATWRPGLFLNPPSPGCLSDRDDVTAPHVTGRVRMVLVGCLRSPVRCPTSPTASSSATADMR